MKKHNTIKRLLVCLVCLIAISTFAQQPVKLNLKRTIELANDSSLSAFRYQNMYLSGYWEYRTYKANRLPSLTLNLMSAIGIIVTCGIVVNDSILKLDSINELRKAGTPLMEAIHTAGVRRLRPIIMTSLTTIMAMVPLLFASDMGSTLQKPLAIAMIGSMLLGTLVSLFIIPLIYWFIYRKHENV